MVIPALNEALRIRGVVEGALAHCPNVIVIDDGSEDGTAERIADLPVTVLRHPQRMGKGASLRDGFAEALRRGFARHRDHGRRRPARGRRHPAPARRRQPLPGHIVIGARLRKRALQPAYRRLANHFGDWGIAWGTGYQIADTQSGQRLYPAAVAALGDVPGEDFVFEAQILISAARQLGTRCVSIPIESRYQCVSDSDEQFRASHFKPMRDFTRITAPHRGAGAAPRRHGVGVPQHPREPAVDRRPQRRVQRRAPRTTYPRRRHDHRPPPRMNPDHDVVILGGGLAGLSLAIQLKQRDPGIDVVVLERHAHPVREAAFKVGESTVEIGAHYFADVLGFREHLETEQIRKFGFRFFFSEGRDDLDRCTELGVSQLLPTPSWQLDRGRFENFLGEQARALGVDFRDGAVVRGFELGEPGATGQVRRTRCATNARARAHELSARWLVDAAGRAGLVKRKLDLAAGQRPRRQRGVVARRRHHRSQRLVRRRRLAAALRPARPLAFDQPHVRPGLLVLADPAGLGLAFAGHRLRREDAPARHHEHARQGDGVAARAPARRRRIRSSRASSRCRTSCSCATSPTAASRCSPATAGR